MKQTWLRPGFFAIVMPTSPVVTDDQRERQPSSRPSANADTSPSPPELVAVLDMGASAIRLVVAEIAPNRSIRTIEEASRGVLLGRDTFSSGVIRSQTVDAALAALEKFRRVIDGYGVQARSRRRHQRGARGAQRRRVPGSDSGTHRDCLRDHQRGRGEPPGLPRGAADARAQRGAARARGRCSPKSAAAAPA